jgi:hypothetical protein
MSEENYKTLYDVIYVCVGKKFWVTVAYSIQKVMYTVGIQADSAVYVRQEMGSFTEIGVFTKT